MIDKILKNINDAIREGKLFKLISIGIAIILALFFVIIIIKVLNKTYTYYDVEIMLKNAAIEYMEDNKNLLPKDSEPAILSISDLENGKYIKSLNKLIKNVSCTAKIEVHMIDNDYEYIPYLNCGDKFNTILFDDKIKENNIVVENGEGLYELNNEFIYRGEKVNNYIEFSNKLWRIIKIDENGNMKLIVSDILKNENDREISRVTWDDRYNSTEKSNYGINSYTLSRIRDTLKEEFETIVEEKDREKLIKFQSCVGKRMIDFSVNNGEAECVLLTDDEYISLLSLHEYIYASLDSTCSSSKDVQCQNYNYFASFPSYWWTLTGVFENTYQIYSINSRGEIVITRASDLAQIRPVIMLKNRQLYDEGDGTLDNPYKIR